MPDSTPPVLWEPAADARTSTRLGDFLTVCEARTGHSFAGYDELWAWSTGDGLEECWAAVWDYFDVISDGPYDRVLDERVMPGARWFTGARLNYAEHIMRSGAGRPGRSPSSGCPRAGNGPRRPGPN